MPFTVKQLLGPNRNPITVYDTEPVHKAQQLMVKNKFSQLPVIDKAGKALGLVTSDSILRALNIFGISLDTLRVLDATEKVKRTFREDDDLFYLLDDLKETAAVLIVDGEHSLKDIVTSYDTTEYFRRRAEDFMYAEDIETTLKDYINAYFTDTSSGEIDEVARAEAIAAITPSNQALLKPFRKAISAYLSQQGVSNPLQDSLVEKIFKENLYHKEKVPLFAALTQDHYITLLLHENHWKRYKDVFSFDQKVIRKLLEDAKAVRNSIAHFRSDEITPEQREKLKMCRDWLLLHENAIKQQFKLNVSVSGAQSVSIVSEVSNSQPAATESVRGMQEAGAVYEEKVSIRGEVDDIPVEPAVSEEEADPSMSRYAPLALWLQERRSDQERIPLTFRQVEAIIGDSLPASARQHPSWWANDSMGHVQSQQWLEVGWRMYSVDLEKEMVIFARSKKYEQAYAAFFAALDEQLAREASFSIRRYSQRGRSWFTIARVPGASHHPVFLSFSFARGHRFRVELYIDSRIKEWNKQIFQKLFSREERIRQELSMVGGELSWERMDNRTASRIALYRDGAITDSEEKLVELRSWACEAMLTFQKVMDKQVSEIV